MTYDTCDVFLCNITTMTCWIQNIVTLNERLWGHWSGCNYLDTVLATRLLSISLLYFSSLFFPSIPPSHCKFLCNVTTITLLHTVDCYNNEKATDHTTITWIQGHNNLTVKPQAQKLTTTLDLHCHISLTLNCSRSALLTLSTGQMLLFKTTGSASESGSSDRSFTVSDHNKNTVTLLVIISDQSTSIRWQIFTLLLCSTKTPRLSQH